MFTARKWAWEGGDPLMPAHWGTESICGYMAALSCAACPTEHARGVGGGDAQEPNAWGGETRRGFREEAMLKLGLEG